MSALRILHLYPDELGINGDSGNVLALAERSRWHGVEVETLVHAPGDELADDADIVHIGSGPLSAQRAVHADLLRIAARLRAWRESGVPFLAIAGGWQLLGTELVTAEGERLEGAGVFPTSAVLGAERHVGEIVVRARDASPSVASLAGYENHSARTIRHDGEPLGTVVSGHGNGDGTEGVVLGASIGSNLHGPLLPMNPVLADRMLTTALGEPLAPTPRTERVDAFAANARRAIAERLGVVL